MTQHIGLEVIFVGFGYLAIVLGIGLYHKRKRYVGKHRAIANEIADTIHGLSPEDAETLRVLLEMADDRDIKRALRRIEDDDE